MGGEEDGSSSGSATFGVSICGIYMLIIIAPRRRLNHKAGGVLCLLSAVTECRDFNMMLMLTRSFIASGNTVTLNPVLE